MQAKLTVSVTQKLFVAHIRLGLGRRHCLETSRTRSVPGHVTEAVIFAWNSNNIQSSSISAVVSFLVENSPLNPRVGARHDIKNPDVEVMSEIKLDCQESTVSCVLIGQFCSLRDSLRDRLLHVWLLKTQEIEMINYRYQFDKLIKRWKKSNSNDKKLWLDFLTISYVEICGSQQML